MPVPISPDEAKKIAAGPLGLELSKFPLRFAKPIFFGDPPSSQTPSRINNGSASLIDFGQGPVAITCSHVLNEFRKLVHEGRQPIAQIGQSRLNPRAQILSESVPLDLAVIRLSEKQAEEIIKENPEIGSSFFKPIRWPPDPVREGDVITFGGFPGQWRTQLAPDVLQFSTFAIGASAVTTVRDSYFVTQFEREYWVKSLENPALADTNNLGELSGAPAFVQRTLHFDFVGVIYEFSSEFDLLYLRPAGLLAANGEIAA